MDETTWGDHAATPGGPLGPRRGSAADPGEATRGIGAASDRRAAGPAAGGPRVGPDDDPDRYELDGDGIPGGEGVIWPGRFVGGLRTPIPVAIKAVRLPSDSADGRPDEAARRRWTDQTALLRHLRVPHLVRVHEAFVGAPPHAVGAVPPPTDAAALGYLVMDWVDGPTLAADVDGREADATTLAGRLGHVVELATAVDVLHSHTRSDGNPLLHADIKPSNCLLHPERGLTLVDLTTMRPLGDAADPHGRHTPAYTAPEVRRDPGAARSPAADLYALGAVAVHCLLGAPPDAVSAGERDAEGEPHRGAHGTDLEARLVAALTRARAQDPAAAGAHVARMLSPDPADRPAHPLAWARELQRLAEPRRSTRPRALWIGAAGLAAVAAVAGGVVLVRPDAGATAGAGPPSAPPSAPSSTPAGTSSTPIGASRTPGTPESPAPDASTWPAGPWDAATGTIASPGPGATVRNCGYLSGTATVPAGVTLILAVRNLDNGDPRRYVQTVDGWRAPHSPWSWHGAQWYGSGNGPVGQHMRMQLVAVSLAEIRKAHDDPDAADAMAGRGKVLAWADYLRGTTPVPPAECPEPTATPTP